MKLFFFSVLFVFSLSNMNAQLKMKLWDNQPPTNNDLYGDEIVNNSRISNVSDPDMTVYLPVDSLNRGIAVIICPGGGYGLLAIEHEGHEFARWLNSHGITGIVLKYRMPNKHMQVPLEDVQRAIGLVKDNSERWGISKEKVGVAGFSAGGHLASTASTHFGNTDMRPAFSVLFYPVISMDSEITHKGSQINLLGESPVASDIFAFSNEKNVNSLTPPAILLLSDDDKSVSPLNSLKYYESLKNNNVKATMYVFPVGGHGWGMNKNFEYHDQMLSLLASWFDKLF